MLAHVTTERFQKIMRVLRHRQPDLTVLAEHVHKPHNLSAMLRSCDAVGVGAAHAVAPTGGVATFNETSASAEKWVRLYAHPSLDDVYRVLKEQNMQLLAAHFSPQARDYRDLDYTRPTCILLGNEKDGVSPQAASLTDAHIIIPDVRHGAVLKRFGRHRGDFVRGAAAAAGGGDVRGSETEP